MAAAGDPTAQTQLHRLEQRLDPLHRLRLEAHLGDTKARRTLGREAPKTLKTLFLEDATREHPNRLLRWVATRSGIYTKLPALRHWGEHLTTWGDEVCKFVAVVALRRCLDTGVAGVTSGTVQSFMSKEWPVPDWGRDRLPQSAWGKELREFPLEAAAEIEEALASGDPSPPLKACELFALVSETGLCWGAAPYSLVCAIAACSQVFRGQPEAVGAVLSSSFHVLHGDVVLLRRAQRFVDSICAEVLPWARNSPAA